MKRLRLLRMVTHLLVVSALLCPNLVSSVAQTGRQAETRNLTSLAAAQQQQQPVARKLAAAQVSPSEIRVNARAPIAFQPFPMVDPKARREVSADSIITLPDGRRVQAGRYYAELNRIEQSLNQSGYSLRTMPDKLVFQESVIERSALQPRILQAREAATSPGATMSSAQLMRRFSGPETLDSGQRVLMADELTPQAVAAVKGRSQPPTAVRPAPPARPPVVSDRVIIPPGVLTVAPKPKVFHREQPWDWSVGSASSFQAYIRGKVVTDLKAYPLSDTSDAELFKSNTEASLNANAQAGGAILGKSADLVQANASFYAPANTSKPLNAKMGISVLGATVYNFNKDFPAKWSTSDTLSYKLSVGVPFGVPLGPVTVGGEIGARGSAGFEYGILLTRAGASGHVNPFVHTAVYGEGGASIYIGGAGIGVEMTLINADLHVYGKGTIGWFIKWMIFDELYCDYSLDMLSGRVYAYVYAYYPCDFIGPIPTDICKKQWEHNFWNWPGFKASGVLVDYKNIVSFEKW